MPKIDFCFSGWVRGANISKATDVEGNTVDVSTMEAGELAMKLEHGKLFISLGDYLYESHKNEVELTDFEATDYPHLA